MLDFLDGVVIKAQSAVQSIMEHGALLDGGTDGLDPGTIIDNGLSTDISSGTFGNLSGKVSEFGGGSYKLLYMVMTFFFICGFILCMLKLFSSNTQNRSEVKSDIMWKVVAGVCGFGVVAFVLLLSGVGQNLFT